MPPAPLRGTGPKPWKKAMNRSARYWSGRRHGARSKTTTGSAQGTDPPPRVRASAVGGPEPHPQRTAEATVYTSGEHCPMCAAAHGLGGPGPHRLRCVVGTAGPVAGGMGHRTGAGGRIADPDGGAGDRGWRTVRRVGGRGPRVAPALPPALNGLPAGTAGRLLTAYGGRISPSFTDSAGSEPSSTILLSASTCTTEGTKDRASASVMSA